jgi:putative hydrolase
VTGEGPPERSEGGEPNPFEGIPLLGDLSRMLQGSAADPWLSARQLGRSIATDGTVEANVDPGQRIRLEELARVAELHVGEITGLPMGVGGVEALNRGEWVDRTIDDWRPLFELLGQGLEQTDDDGDGGPADPMAQLFGGMMRMLAPMMLGLSAGSLVGHVGQRAFGDYELPLPRRRPRVAIVVPNLAAFASEWEIEPDNLGLWVCLEQLTLGAVLRQPAVADTIDDLLREYVSSFSNQPVDLEERFSGLDPTALTDPSALQDLFGDPEVLLGAIRSPAQDGVLRRIEAVVAVLFGYADHVLDEAGSRLIGSFAALAEAVRRRRVEASPADRFVERLLGVELTREGVNRGQAFVSGVLARAGRDGLARLWEPGNLPTPNELDAPGLWLARIELPPDEITAADPDPGGGPSPEA